jgi:DNA polymerase III subunit beta
MRLTIERAALNRALGHVQAVVEKRHTMPILANVLLDAREGSLRLVATDLDMEMAETVPADIEQPGIITTQAAYLFDIVRKLPEPSTVRIEYEGDGQRLILSAGRGRYELSTLSDGDFPKIKADGLTASFDAQRADLARLIDRTKFAISTEETRYYLNGIYLHVTEDAGVALLRAVATDGHRLALADVQAPAESGQMQGVIVPRKAVEQLRKLLDSTHDVVTISASETMIRFSIGAATLTSKLIDGTFPDYRRVIPRDNTLMMRVETKAFAAAVDRVATLSSERTKSVKLEVKSEGLKLSVNNPESGQASEEVVAEYDAEPITIGFNARYLNDVTSQIASGETEFAFADANAPALVRDPSDDKALFVLMPLRV